MMVLVIIPLLISIVFLLRIGLILIGLLKGPVPVFWNVVKN